MGKNIQNELQYLKDTYNIGTITISKLLGCSKTSIYAYEAGSEPSRIHISLIKLICLDQMYLRDLALINKEYLNDSELKLILTTEQYELYLKYLK